MSIKSFLTEYAAKVPSRWHTPGHKGTLHSLDITELCDGSFPANFIKDAQKKAADFYYARYCRFLTGGSSMGIKAAILAAKGDVIAPKSRHQSLGEGAKLAGVNLCKFDTGLTDGGLPNVPSLADVTAAMEKYPSAKVVFLESPDYYGRVIDPNIIPAIRRTGKLFFCDAAHGAHFPSHKGLVLKHETVRGARIPVYVPLFPRSYADTADVCNLSAHKTLDAYTQAAYLCVNHNGLVAPIDQALKLLGTTSPSYLLLASLETAIDAAAGNSAEYERLYADVLAFREKISCLTNDDFTRLVVDAGVYGMTGQALCSRLAAQNVYAETFCGNYAVFIATPHETKEDLESLANAVRKAAEGN